MKALRRSVHRLIGVLVLCVCAVLPALLPVAAQAGPVPTITAAVLPTPVLHLHVLGLHFTPSSSVNVQVEYLPSATFAAKTVTANPFGVVVANFVIPSFCIDAIRVRAFSRQTNKVSNLVILNYQHCG